MIPFVSGSFLAKQVRSWAAALGYRIERDFKPLTLSPKNILRVEPSWLLAKLGTCEQGISFIQIGANDGIRCDPVRPYVLKHEWTGLLVEPDPVYFDQLKRNYDGTPGLQFLNAAVGEGLEAEFFAVAKDAPGYPDWAFGIGSLDRQSILRHAHLLPGLERYVESSIVPVVTLNDLAKIYCDNKVDLVVVDVEGYDAEIIESIDASRWKPKAIFYECVHLGRDRHEQLLTWLVSNGYSIHVGDQDSFAVLPELWNSMQVE